MASSNGGALAAFCSALSTLASWHGQHAAAGEK